MDSHITDRSSLYRIALRVGTTSLRYSLSLDYQKVRYILKGVGGGSHMKRAGMLVVSLRGVNFGFWSQGVLDKTPVYLAVKVSFSFAREEI